MKIKYLAPLFLAAGIGSAHAQSSVSLYGSIDEGVTYNTNAKGSGTATTGPVAVPDFFGLRGSEDLGNQYKAVFALQEGFLSNTGASTIAGEMFSHFAYVGLGSPFGTITLGRQLDLTTEALRLNSNGSLQATFYLFHPANLDNLGIMGDSINNAVRYSSPDLHGFTFNAVYGFADGSTQPGRVYSVDASYSHGPFRASAVYSNWNDHSINLGSLGYTSFLGESLANGALFLARNQQITGLSAWYTFSRKVDVHGVLSQVNLTSTASSGRMRTAELGADIHVTPANTITVGGHFSWLTGTRYAEGGIGDIYALSKQTIVYAQAVYENANGNGKAGIPLLSPSSNSNQAAFRVGIHHFF